MKSIRGTDHHRRSGQNLEQWTN